MFFKSKKAAAAPPGQESAPAPAADPTKAKASNMPENGPQQPSLAVRMAASAQPPAAANATRDAAVAASSPAALPPDELRKRAAVSKQMIAAFGEIVSVVMRASAWRSRPIADLESMILPPLVSGQFSLAEAQSKAQGTVAPVAVVLWARVSPEVDQRLSASLDAPISLAPADWTSGEQIWIVEAIGEPVILQPMLQRLAQKEWAGKSVKLRAKGQDGKVHVGVLALRLSDAIDANLCQSAETQSVMENLVDVSMRTVAKA